MCRHLCILLLCLPLGTQAATIYRCQQGASSQYSDKPCASSAEIIRLPNQPESESATPESPRALEQLADQRLQAERQAAQTQRQQNQKAWAEAERLQRLQRERRVGRGMEQSAVRRMRGSPDEVRVGSDHQGEWELWLYRRDRLHTDQIRFRDGKVVSVH